MSQNESEREEAVSLLILPASHYAQENTSAVVAKLKHKKVQMADVVLFLISDPETSPPYFYRIIKNR